MSPRFFQQQNKLQHKLLNILFTRRKSSSTTTSTSLPLPTFIATPIFYVNAAPHIGHLYTTVYADALHRFTRLCCPNIETIYSTGTDEHGLKIQKAAQSKNIDLSIYCDQVSKKFCDLFKSSDISYTHFIRTTEIHHKNAVQNFWSRLVEKGFIYKSTYSGYYSINDESFVPDNMIKTDSNGDRISMETGHKLEWHEEENYIFRLSKVQNQVVDWINTKMIMKPDNFHLALKADVKNLKTFKDISVSRSKSRLQWGIQVPNDESQLIYVWFDALVNYLTVTGYPKQMNIWPPCHVIGKDIIKFHCIYWPAFLFAAGIEPPNLFYCHSHWLYDKQKMSKSLGNVVDPFDCINRFTSDGIRYFLLKQGTPQSDSNFNMESVKICLNADLADTLGNLLNRCTSKKLNPKQTFPRFSYDELIQLLPECQEILKCIQNLSKECHIAYSNGNFHIGINNVMNCLHQVNGLFNIVQPWILVDSSSSSNEKKRAECLIYLTLETLRISAIILDPIVPRIARMILLKLNVNEKLCAWKSAEDILFDDLKKNPNNNDDDHDHSSIKIDPKQVMIFSKI